LDQDEAPSSQGDAKAPEGHAAVSPDEAPSLPAEEKRPDLVWVRAPTEGLWLGARWPLLAFLLVLGYGVLVFARGSVEGVVRERVRTRLAEQGLGFASVDVSGQNVVLRGTPLAAADRDRALLLAERTTCPTLFGDLDCTIDVRDEFQAAAPPRAAVLSAAEQADVCDRQLADLLSRSRIEFATSGAEIQPASRPLLAEIAAVAARCPGRLRVEGHTDGRGSADGNMRLSRARAEAVCDALAALGVPRARLLAEGLGETRPIAPDTTAEGRAQNRRIEIRVVRE
jgi:outer membrane protein OmpA-like peptidoglycan-associated protein